MILYSLAFSLLFLLSITPSAVVGREFLVDDPGEGMTVHLLEAVPNVLGSPGESDPRITIQSPVPVTILRYNDNTYLEGAQPIRPTDIYVVVKSNCSQAAFLPEIEYASFETSPNTGTISISLGANEGTTAVSEPDFPAPSTFLAYFSYTSFFCEEAQAFLTPSPTPASSSNDNQNGFLFSLFQFLRALLSFLTQPQSSSIPQRGRSLMPSRFLESRRLEETCTPAVEIIVDGCRRYWQKDKTDLIVEAPVVRIQDSEVVPLSQSTDPENECTTNYDASIRFPVNGPSLNPIEAGQGFLIPSLTEDFNTGIQCARAIEGRPFVDATGKQVQAAIQNGNVREASWSTRKTVLQGSIEENEALGVEWKLRALGEHASIPAFAAFTIALMSNNAPQDLVQDALTAAMDEVRHAQTSFEVASLLLGETVEPGPLASSKHEFGQDLKALAIAAAKEGCVEETLSSLAAAYEVVARLDARKDLAASTKAVLKEKIFIIAREETEHSALAWRTVRWACQTDVEVCSAVKSDVFEASFLENSFEKRFGGYRYDQSLKQAWDTVHKALVPYVSRGKVDTAGGLSFDCNQFPSMKRELIGYESGLGGDNALLLMNMARSIIHSTMCPSSKLLEELA